MNAEVVCLYGVEGLSTFQEWLAEDPKRSLVCLEDDERLLAAFAFVQNPQLRFYLIAEETCLEVFKQIAWEFIFSRFSYHVHPSKKDDLLTQMKSMQVGVELLASDYRDLGTKILRNVRLNMPLLSQARKGQALKERFKGVPALICGAGPSLAKNGRQLAALKNRALIFAGGSALTVLDHLGVQPHFAASLDPDPPLERFLQQSGFEVPFFYQSRLSHAVLSLVQGPRLWIADNGGYPIERWLAKELGLPAEPFDGGWTVGNLCTALALLLGCEPLIFVGMDFCAEGERLYGPGIEAQKQETRRDWIQAAEWMAQCAQEHKERLFLNATEGGLGFQGIANLTLNEASQQYLRYSFDLEGRIHSALQQTEQMRATEEPIARCLQQIEGSCVRSQGYLRNLLFLMERFHPQLPYDKGEFILNECELEEELAYQKILEPLWMIWRPIFKRLSPPEFSEKLQKILFFEQIWKDMNL